MLAGYYWKNKERLQKKKKEAHKNYLHISEEKKNKKCQNACERYQNLSEAEKFLKILPQMP